MGATSTVGAAAPPAGALPAEPDAAPDVPPAGAVPGVAASALVPKIAPMIFPKILMTFAPNELQDGVKLKTSDQHRT
jgi:hypothetical protein